MTRLTFLSYPNVNSEKRDIIAFLGFHTRRGTQQVLNNVDYIKLNLFITTSLKMTCSLIIPWKNKRTLEDHVA